MDELLKSLVGTYGPSANEKKVKDIIKEEIKSYVDEIEEDKLGNLVGIKKGNGKKIMISAPMDEISLIISHVDKGGRIKFAPMGEINPIGLINNTVKFENGVCGVICLENEKKDIKLENLYINIGALNDKEVFDKLNIGDAAVLFGNYFESDKSVISNSLSTRYACKCLINIIKNISKENKNDLYFVFSTHGVIGARGARVAANYIKPEIGVSIDSVNSALIQDNSEGSVLLYRGLNEVSNRNLLEELNQVAEKLNVNVNKQVILNAICDCSSIVSAGIDAKVVSIAIPVKNYHTSSEIVVKNDVFSIEKILSNFLEN